MGKPARLAQELQRALDRLKAVPGVERFYLAGGTAIAYHLGHRTSADLDLFSREPVDLDSLRSALLRVVPDARVLSQTDVSLRAIVGATPIDLVSYDHPPLAPLEAGPAGFVIAGLLDLAAMKLVALTRRGLRRDFWDLHAILDAGISLREVADAYVQRFRVAEPDLYHVLRALTYFEDADKDAHYPAGLTKKHWEEIKAFFGEHAPELLAKK